MIKGVAVGLLIALILVPVTSRAQFRSCAEWNEMPELAKMGYATGWMEGSAIAAGAISGDTKARHAFWPQGHRVGSVKIELDIACKKNPALHIYETMRNIIDEQKAK